MLIAVRLDPQDPLHARQTTCEPSTASGYPTRKKNRMRSAPKPTPLSDPSSAPICRTAHQILMDDMPSGDCLPETPRARAIPCAAGATRRWNSCPIRRRRNALITIKTSLSMRKLSYTKTLRNYLNFPLKRRSGGRGQSDASGGHPFSSFLAAPSRPPARRHHCGDKAKPRKTLNANWRTNTAS